MKTDQNKTTVMGGHEVVDNNTFLHAKNRTLLRSGLWGEEDWQGALQKRKYQSVQALFTFSFSYIYFVFSHFLSASQSPIASFWTEAIVWELPSTLVVNDLFEGAGRVKIIKWLETVEGSPRYFWRAKKIRFQYKK